ncbi:MAG: DUF4876 domain-containing protein [Rikenellaceae bacterium]|nr:DUF4876 domain-containing protein [Rikenellaceae bacterium]
MRKLFYALMAGVVLLGSSCNKNDDEGYKTHDVAVRLVYDAAGNFDAVAGVPVSVRSTINDATYTGETDANGVAEIKLPAGVYEVSATDKRTETGAIFILSGVASNVTVTDAWSADDEVTVNMSESKLGQVVIKELYCGGSPIDGETRVWANDKYVILYNNSEEPAQLENLCLAVVYPTNSTASTNYDYVDGKLWYEAQQTVPASCIYWAFTGDVTLNPGEQVTVALSGAINHTTTYPHSVDLSGADTYVTYDANFTNTTIHPTPSELIPTSQWLKAYVFGTSTMWSVDRMSPAMFIFSPTDGTTLDGFLTTQTNYYQDRVQDARARKMVPQEWVIDGVEVFQAGSTKNKKRLTAAVDAGAIEMTAGQGYSLYRNVDKAATEAIEANAGKIVYSYAGGTTDSTDPSGIDAEASIKQGARIVYKDTNNSTNDFHQRAKASIKNN